MQQQMDDQREDMEQHLDHCLEHNNATGAVTATKFDNGLITTAERVDALEEEIQRLVAAMEQLRLHQDEWKVINQMKSKTSATSMVADVRNAECFYCHRRGHLKSECRQRRRDLRKHNRQLRGQNYRNDNSTPTESVVMVQLVQAAKQPMNEMGGGDGHSAYSGVGDSGGGSEKLGSEVKRISYLDLSKCHEEEDDSEAIQEKPQKCKAEVPKHPHYSSEEESIEEH
uniref:CCHC-type domain-containing protein n=1 Tax=Panagrolaimus davidi TaxID=227884 RepID=A0A914PL01_9BILA